MSYPSITKILQREGIDDLGIINEARAEELLLEALETDLPEGVAYLHNMAHEALNSKTGRVMRSEKPDSKIGKQLIRLLGTPVAKRIVEAKIMHGCVSALYNCCNPVVAVDKEKLKISAIEQIKLQNGELSSADC